MVDVTKAEMIEKLTHFIQELGLTNAEIAEKLNEEFEATDATRIGATHVSKIKEQLGLKGMKPKKKALFRLVDGTPKSADLASPSQDFEKRTTSSGVQEELY